MRESLASESARALSNSVSTFDKDLIFSDALLSAASMRLTLS